MGTLEQYRHIWLEGAVSGGKTSLAVAIAQAFCQRGYRCVANFPLVFAEDPKQISLDENGMAKLVVILDEAGTWLSSIDGKAFKAYLGKLDIFLIISSVEAPPTAFHKFRAEVELNYMHKVGLPIIEYIWTLERKGKKDYTGSFWWANSWSVWGMYSRQNPGLGAQGLDRMMTRMVHEFVLHHNDGKELSESENPNTENYFWIKTADDQAIEAAHIMARAAERMERASQTAQTGKRKPSLFKKILG